MSNIQLNTPSERITALRAQMAHHNIDAFVVYSADPHLSEYLPEEWQERTWLSGFTGSAGFVVVTQDKAALWTDGRYFMQAGIELKNSGIELMKMGVDSVPSYTDWLKSELQEGGIVAVNTLAASHSSWLELEGQLASKNIKIVNHPLLAELWIDRNNEQPKHPIFVHPLERAGQSVEDKLTNIRQKMTEQGADFHIISSLDDVAWTVNLRGSDVAYNPVFLGYITVTKDLATLYVDIEKLTPEAVQHLNEARVEAKPYDDFFADLKKVEHQNVLISPNSNQSIFEALSTKNHLIKAAVPGNLMKAQKNETELEGFRIAMQRDGVAMVKFLYWLKHTAGKEALTEYSIGKKLKNFRAEGKNFVGESFGSIIGYKENGAIIHYSAKEEDSKAVTNDGSILVDSGGQYLEGTTDITRTIALGKVSEELKKEVTLVLKGMIGLSMVKFPKGTKGVHLDAIARMPLWLEGKDYNHGTGHGVGSFMNVHEGPQNIRKDMNPQELLPGMVCSNEPGFYLDNGYGIRLENLIAVKEAETTPFGTFYEFETLTLCPFDREFILVELLTPSEKQWLNDYHQWCEKLLAPDLEGDTKEWFLQQVKPL